MQNKTRIVMHDGHDIGMGIVDDDDFAGMDVMDGKRVVRGLQGCRTNEVIY